MIYGSNLSEAAARLAPHSGWGVSSLLVHITDNLTGTNGIEIIMAFKQIYTNIAKDDNGDNDNTKDDDINVDNVDKDDNDDDEKRMC